MQTFPITVTLLPRLSVTGSKELNLAAQRYIIEPRA